MDEIKQEKLIVEGIGENTTKEDIINHFKDCGQIKSLNLIKFNSNNNTKSYEIVFEDKSSLFKALEKNATKINGSMIDIYINNSLNNIYNTRKSTKKQIKNEIKNNDFINISDSENKSELSDEINTNNLLNDYSQSENIDDISQNKNHNQNKENVNNSKISNNTLEKFSDENGSNISNINMALSESDDEEISDNEGYNNFMKEYKQYCKGIKKSTRKEIDGEVNVQELLQKANNYYLNDNYKDAKEVLETIITVEPSLQEPYLLLSQIYEEEKNDENSLFFLMLAAQSSKGDKDIWVKCCNYNKKLKKFRQAEYCITRALKLDKKNIYILYERGALNEELGYIYKAIKIFTVLFNIYPNNDILYHVIKLCEKVNNVDKGIELFEKYFNKLKNKIEGILFVYDVYLKHKKFLKGKEFYENSLLINTDAQIQNMIKNNCEFKLKKNFCYLNEIKENKNIINEIKNDFISIIENNIEYSENCLRDNLQIFLEGMVNLDNVDLFINIYNELEKLLIKNIDIISMHKNIISEIKFQLGNYYFSNNNF